MGGATLRKAPSVGGICNKQPISCCDAPWWASAKTASDRSICRSSRKPSWLNGRHQFQAKQSLLSPPSSPECATSAHPAAR
eukprot:2595483-Pleurochrysis_carterae.AAC.1